MQFREFGFQDVWTPVTLSSRLGKRPLPITLAGHKLVLFRAKNGEAVALRDRCPHRGTALSLGKVQDGCLTCPFHGWRFDSSGNCVTVPLANGVRHERLSATSFPVREEGGLIWVFSGERVEEEPAVPKVLAETSLHSWRTVKRWNAHWTRAMETLLDAAHLPFVHRHTIGIGVRRKMKPASELRVHTTPTGDGFDLRWSLDGEETPAQLSWRQPNAMSMQVGIPGRRMYLHVWVVPVGPRETDLIVINQRDFGRFRGGRLFDQLNHVILHEDQRVVESMEPAEVPHPSLERSVAYDKPTLTFRRWYLERKQEPREQETWLELH